MSIFSDIFVSLTTGLVLGGGMCLISFFIDKTFCKDSFEIVCKQTPELYIDGIFANLTNMFLIGPITYSVIEYCFIDKTTYYIQPLNLVSILLFHNCGYYITHFMMHKPLLCKIHNFHHKFDKFLLPSIGNAVSPNEFIIAYMSPFIISAIYLGPNQTTFITSISIISILNMAIHCRELELIEWPKIFVSPSQHIEHHKIKTKHYAAPLLNLDYIFNGKNKDN